MFLKVENIQKIFNENNGVRNIKLEINKGEIITLLGPSGCGKTTTLNLIGGFLKSDSGKIILDNEDITNWPPEKRPITTVFQSYALFPHMNVVENIAYGLKYTFSLKKKERLEKAREYISIVGLDGYEKSHVGNLSGGQQQRVALARALITSPKLLLLDEPFSNLDAKLRVKMREDLKRIQSELDITMIFVTHDQEEAFAISDRIVVMDKRNIVQIGNPKDIYCNPKNEYVAKFVGKANIINEYNTKYLVRPEDIVITKDSNGIFKIKNKLFMGSYTMYDLSDGENNIKVDLFGFDNKILNIGDKVNIKANHGKQIL